METLYIYSEPFKGSIKNTMHNGKVDYTGEQTERKYIDENGAQVTEISFINQNFETTRGIITKKSVYKGHNIRVKYKVNGIIYENSDGFNVNDNIQEGDSINLKYSKTKPELMITEFNEEY